VKWAQWDKTQSRELLVCWYVCASHCAQLLHTILHRTDLTVFPLTFQTITTARMMSIWGKGVPVVLVKGKGFPYSTPSVGPAADPGVQAVSPQVTVSHPPSGRLPLLSARPVVTSPATEHHRRLAGTKLYCLVTEAHRCKQLAQGCYAASPRDLLIASSNALPVAPQRHPWTPM